MVSPRAILLLVALQLAYACRGSLSTRLSPGECRLYRFSGFCRVFPYFSVFLRQSALMRGGRRCLAELRAGQSESGYAETDLKLQASSGYLAWVRAVS